MIKDSPKQTSYDKNNNNTLTLLVNYTYKKYFKETMQTIASNIKPVNKHT